MPTYRYTGDAEALASAKASLALPDVNPIHVQRLPSYGKFVHLVAQAAHGDPAHAPAILAEAEKHLHVLAVAHETATAILHEMEAAFTSPNPGA